jgi:hypothetical protein
MKNGTIKTNGLGYNLIVEDKVIMTATNKAALISWATSHGYTIF